MFRLIVSSILCASSCLEGHSLDNTVTDLKTSGAQGEKQQCDTTTAGQIRGESVNDCPYYRIQECQLSGLPSQEMIKRRGTHALPFLSSFQMFLLGTWPFWSACQTPPLMYLLKRHKTKGKHQVNSSVWTLASAAWGFCTTWQKEVGTGDFLPSM